MLILNIAVVEMFPSPFDLLISFLMYSYMLILNVAMIEILPFPFDVRLFFTCLVSMFAGYSFSLTWTNNSCGEGELVYHLSSLGTFERVAPEWMRETMMFSTSMCPVFFERVSRVIKG